jgi:predicted phosphoribosyltransferase
MRPSDATEVPPGHRDCTSWSKEIVMARPARFEEPYRDRRHAGAELARHLAHVKGLDIVVLALPRGGVPVAFEVAHALEAPLDVFVVRKLGMPGHPEFAMGAIASGGTRVLNDEVVKLYRIPDQVVDAIARDERIELERRERAYRAQRPPLDVRGRTVVLIDDGLATGSTMKAAVEAVRALAPHRIIVAVPVGSPETCREFAAVADDIICARAPEHFAAVGQWYDDFRQTTDEEVRELLAAASEPAGKPQ